MQDIREVAGRHLGRTMSGELMTPYVATDKHDASLLVPIPRKLGRTKSNIESNMVCGDIWHAYEFSFLLKNNQPQTGILKIFFHVSTVNMIESKSLKLYLNSFDFEQFDDISSVLNIINNDLAKVADGPVKVDFISSTVVDQDKYPVWIYNHFDKNSIDNKLINDISFDESVETLRTLLWNDVSEKRIKYFHTANLRSACEITNQKDTGHCFIAMSGEAVFDSKELARFIFSIRNAQHFHENVTEIIFEKMIDFYQPDNLVVLNVYNRRGGLDIHPMRATSWDFAHLVFPNYLDTTKLIKLTKQV